MRNHINKRLDQVMSQFSTSKVQEFFFSIGVYLVFYGFKKDSNNIQYAHGI